METLRKVFNDHVLVSSSLIPANISLQSEEIGVLEPQHQGFFDVRSLSFVIVVKLEVLQDDLENHSQHKGFISVDKIFG